MVLVVTFFFAFNLSPVAAQTTASDKRTKIIIAGMISGFLSYIKWPENGGVNDEQPAFTVGILGEDKVFFSAMQRYLAQRTEKEKRLFNVVQVSQTQLTCCQVLVVLGDSSIETEDILSKVAYLPILTVSDQKDFAATGGHINFFYQQGKLRFEVNWQATLNANLKVSSRLLSLAKVINKPAKKPRS